MPEKVYHICNIRIIRLKAEFLICRPIFPFCDLSSYTDIHLFSLTIKVTSTQISFQAILDALLSSKSLQEKIADNINKVATRYSFHFTFFLQLFSVSY